MYPQHYEMLSALVICLSSISSRLSCTDHIIIIVIIIIICMTIIIIIIIIRYA